jgi:integrase/recombinase XerD
MIKATKIIHREQTRIKINLPYNQAYISLVCQIEEATWSAAHKAGHIPHTKQAFNQLK